MDDYNFPRFSLPFPRSHPLQTHPWADQTHKRQRDTKALREKERSLLGWPIWILSKGIASRYGDLENSPCSLIPLLFLQAKGIQWKLIPRIPGFMLLFLLGPDRNVAENRRKNQQGGKEEQECRHNNVFIVIISHFTLKKSRENQEKVMDDRHPE